MALPYWQEVDLTIPLRLLAGTETLLYLNERRGVVVTVRARYTNVGDTLPAELAVMYTVLPSLEGTAWITPEPVHRVADVAKLLGFPGRYRVVAIPPVRKRSTLFRNRPAVIATAGSLHLDGSNLLEYVRARLRGERPETQLSEVRREAILDRAQAVVDEYTALKLDVAYRIENSALFDPAVPTTQALEVALVRWQNEADLLAMKELDALASEVEIAYAVARDHAETVGFSHLPGAKEADARRAAKAARLAERASSEGERIAAQEQVVRILESLALHYLPAALAGRKEISPPSG
ncbi:MAG: hypothetical protein Q4G35_09345 [Propionibacteriaceae bacterium]|nr:hypothetical protein [Propionibacteriaceae bacterium]